MVAKSNEDLEREVLNTEGLISNRVAGVIASISQATTRGLILNELSPAIFHWFSSTEFWKI